ncbi:MAG: hypothetical protein ACRDXX_17450 [Stackebrandtia sp.]
MCSDFDAKLSDLSTRIRRWAVKREFEEEGYSTIVDSDWIAPPEGYEPGKPFTDGTQAMRPLTPEIYKQGYDPEYPGYPTDAYYAEEGSEVWNQKYDELTWVDEAIMQFGQSNPSELQGLLTRVQDIPELLCGDAAWKETEGPLERYEDRDSGVLEDEAFRADILLENGMAEFRNWDGETAGVYRRAFGDNGDKWREIVQGDYYLAEVLVAAAEAQLAVYITARESIVNICESTRLALWGMEDPGESGGGWGTLLVVLGAIAATSLTLASAGTAAAIVGASFTISAAIVRQAESGDVDSGVGEGGGEKIEISGDTVRDVLYSMDRTINTLIEQINDAETQIREVLLNAYNDAVADGGVKPRYQLILEAGAPELSEETMGGRNVDADPGDLAAAAVEAFPPAAERLLGAHEALVGSGGDGGEFNSEVYSGPNSVQSAWMSLRRLLQDITGGNGEKVEHAGEVLLQYAKETGAVDETAAQEVEQTYGELDVEYSGQTHEPYEESVADRKGL